MWLLQHHFTPPSLCLLCCLEAPSPSHPRTPVTDDPGRPLHLGPRPHLQTPCPRSPPRPGAWCRHLGSFSSRLAWDPALSKVLGTNRPRTTGRPCQARPPRRHQHPPPPEAEGVRATPFTSHPDAHPGLCTSKRCAHEPRAVQVTTPHVPVRGRIGDRPHSPARTCRAPGSTGSPRC